MLPTPQTVMPERLDPNIPPDRDTWWEESVHIWRYFWAAAKQLPQPVLDAACGTGYGTRILGAAGHDAVGIDRDYRATLLAQDRYPDTFIVGDVEGFNAQHFGTVVSFETIEHLNDPGLFLGNLRCTQLLASVPIVPTTSYNIHHKHDFTHLSFLMMLKNAGWKVVEEHLQSHPERINVYCVVRCVR